MPQAIPVKSPIFLFYQDNDVGVDKIAIGEYASYKGNLYVLDNKANVDKNTTVLQAVMHRNLLPLDMDTFVNQILAQMHQNGLIITSENLNKNFMRKSDADALYIKSIGLGEIEAGDLLDKDKDYCQRIWELKPGRYLLDADKLNNYANTLEQGENSKPESERRFVYKWWAVFGLNAGKYLIDILEAAKDYRIVLAYSIEASDCYWAHVPKRNDGTGTLKSFVDLSDPYTANNSLRSTFENITPGTQLSKLKFTNNNALTGVHHLTNNDSDRLPDGCPVQDRNALARITNLGRTPNTYLMEIISTTEGIWYSLIQEDGNTHEYHVGAWTQVQGGGGKGGDVPVGTVIGWDNRLPIPTGYVEAKGQELPKADYNDLFQLIGVKYGQAGNVDNFKIPNLNDDDATVENVANKVVRRDGSGVGKFSGLISVNNNPVPTGFDPNTLKENNYTFVVRNSQNGVLYDIPATEFFTKVVKGGGGTSVGGNNSTITLDVDVSEEIDVDGELYIEGTTSDLNVERGDFFQPGQYGFFAMKNPKGRWLFCDGREISREHYPELFEAIGTTYGEGNGTTTFNIPDRRGYFGRCLDAGAEVDYQSDRAIGSKQGDAIRNITGYLGTNFLASENTIEGAFETKVNGTNYQYVGNGSYTGLNTTFDASKVVPTAPENVVKNIAEYVCIRY